MSFGVPRILALDLEGTLISGTQIARPGLFEFLIDCDALFERVVVLATLNEPQFGELAACLIAMALRPSGSLTSSTSRLQVQGKI